MQQKEVLLIVGVLVVGLFLFKQSALSGRSIYENYITYPNQRGGLGTDAFQEPIEQIQQQAQPFCCNACSIIDGISDSTQPPSSNNPYGGWHRIFGVLTENGNQCGLGCSGVCVYQSVNGGQYTLPCVYKILVEPSVSCEPGGAWRDQ